MPSICPKADMPPLPSSADLTLKPPQDHTPLEAFISKYEPNAIDGKLHGGFRDSLTLALHWYVAAHTHLFHENMSNKRREELGAGFDHVPTEDEGSQL